MPTLWAFRLVTNEHSVHSTESNGKPLAAAWSPVGVIGIGLPRLVVRRSVSEVTIPMERSPSMHEQ